MDQIDEDCNLLVEKIKELGSVNKDGNCEVLFGKLFEATVDIFEALNGTLRSGFFYTFLYLIFSHCLTLLDSPAKKRKLIDFEGQMLLKGASDKVAIKLLV